MPQAGLDRAARSEPLVDPFSWENSMKQPLMRRIATLTTSVGLLLSATAVPRMLAQEISAPPYLNPGLSPEVRATDLVHRMTLEGQGVATDQSSARDSPAQSTRLRLVE
jgi:hypothetical protein